MSDKVVKIIKSLREHFANDPKVLKKVNYLSWVIKESDSDLVPTKLIDGAYTNLQRAFQYKNNIQQAYGFLDAALIQLPQPWNKKRSRSDSQKLIDQAVEDISLSKSSAELKLANLDAKIIEKTGDLERLEKELNSIKNRVDTESSRLDTMVTSEQASLAQKKNSN